MLTLQLTMETKLASIASRVLGVKGYRHQDREEFFKDVLTEEQVVVKRKDRQSGGQQ